MDELEKEKEIVKLEKTLVNNRGQKEFVLEIRQMDKAQLKAKLADLNEYKNAIISTRDSDDKLKEAAKHVQSLRKPYSDDLKYNKEKDRFVALVLEDEFGEES